MVEYDTSKSKAECKELVNFEIIRKNISDYLTFRLGGKTKNTLSSYTKWSEDYKWDILPKLNNLFKQEGFTASNIIDKVIILQKHNPSQGSFVHWSSLDSFLKLAKKEPKIVSELMNSLFQESVPLHKRIDNFRTQVKNIDKKPNYLGTPLFGYIMAAFDCNEYPVYKGEVFSYIKTIFEKKDEWRSFSIGMKYEKFKFLSFFLGEYLNQNNLLKEIIVNDVEVKPGNFALDGQDFFYVAMLRARARNKGSLSISNKIVKSKIIELLKKKKQIIFYGPPGTGKTYKAFKVANLVSNSYEFVEDIPSRENNLELNLSQKDEPGELNGYKLIENKDYRSIKSILEAKAKRTAMLHFLIMNLKNITPDRPLHVVIKDVLDEYGIKGKGNHMDKRINIKGKKYIEAISKRRFKFTAGETDPSDKLEYDFTVVEV